MCIDFHCNRTVISPIMYLGVVLDTKLSFTEHVTELYAKEVSTATARSLKVASFQR